MSYYNRYKNKKRQNNGGSNPNDANNLGILDSQPADAIFDLGKNKRVTVRQFRNINLIDIREYYLDQSTGEMRPGKKGISLTEDLYDELLKHRLNIDDALRRFGSKRARTKTVRLYSDDEEDEDDKDNDDIKEKGDDSKDGNDTNKNKSDHKKDSDTKTSKKRVRERDMKENEEFEIKTRKQKIAPPTLLPHEENIENAKREANATLVIPGLANKPAVVPVPEVPSEQHVKSEENPPKLAQETTTEQQNKQEQVQEQAEEQVQDQNDNSSDGEDLEAEMNKIFDDISEEE